MPYKCFVAHCRSNYASEIAKVSAARRPLQVLQETTANVPEVTPGYVSMHQPPKGMFDVWKNIIPKREDKEFNKQSRVCRNHFLPEDFHPIQEITINGEVFQTAVKKTLKKSAIPSIFPKEIPSYLIKTPAKKRSPPKMRLDTPPAVKKPKRAVCENGSHQLEKITNELDQQIDQQAMASVAVAGLERPTDMDLDLSNTEDASGIGAFEEAQEPPASTTESFFDDLLQAAKLHLIEHPLDWIVEYQDDAVAFSKLKFIFGLGPSFEKTILVQRGCPTASLVINGRPVKVSDAVVTCLQFSSVDAIAKMLAEIDQKFKLCCGARNNTFGTECSGLLSVESRALRCNPCAAKENAITVAEYRKKRAKRGPTPSVRQKMLALKTSQKQLTKQLKEKDYLLECARADIEHLKKNNAFNKLPEAQQTMIKECIAKAQTKPKGHRYSREWMFECLLMRIRGPALYRHIIKHNILPLPPIGTIQRHLRSMKATYGFQDRVFDAMSYKGSQMKDPFKRGVLMIDEMKVTPDTKFNITNHQFEGFVDLGNHTPQQSEGQLGDHGLVFMFRPFMGNWVQAVGCFLSKGNANGDTLTKLTLEAITLLEKSGYFVDGVVTDGASWNRSMWKKFGIDSDKGSCKHPLESDEGTRELFFFSDFPHLIKCVRSFVVNAEEFTCPEGVVKLDHWRAVAKHSEEEPFGLNASSGKFNSSSLKKDSLTKMNVGVAFKFFGNTVKSAMQLLREKRLDAFPALQDCQGTLAFIERFNKLIDIMNSKNRSTAFWHNDNATKEFLSDFLLWLDLWDDVNNGAEHHLSSSTRLGLRVTLRATLGLLDFLSTQGFLYLMTDRLNQDPLEHFFGMLRANGGLNDHPEASRFAHLYRLMSIYSLVKPPRGSNITGGELYDTVLKTKDAGASTDSSPVGLSRDEIMRQIASVVRKCSFDPNLMIELPVEKLGESGQKDLSDSIAGYMAGYVAKKALKKWCGDCSGCRNALVGSDPKLRFNSLIDFRSYGFLTFPSTKLFQLIVGLESVVFSHLKHQGVRENTLLTIMNALLEKDDMNLLQVGCDIHAESITEKIIYFYLTTRMYFASRVEKRLNASRAKAKALAKKSKLVTKAS